jgi:hypothetical protein
VGRRLSISPGGPVALESGPAGQPHDRRDVPILFQLARRKSVAPVNFVSESKDLRAPQLAMLDETLDIMLDVFSTVIAKESFLDWLTSSTSNADRSAPVSVERIARLRDDPQGRHARRASHP